VLASLVDGRRSPREVQWTHELASELGYTAEQMKQLEVSMADFYRTHRDVVDVFTLADGADVMGEEWVDELSTMVRKNSRAVLNEIRKTGELSVLLARAARGRGLSADEKRRMREQLLDVARAVPALALFAAPGGALVLLALTRVLPFKLLPSSFWDEVETPETTPEKTKETMPEKTKETMPEKTKEKTQEKAPEKAQEKTMEKRPERKPERKTDEKAGGSS